MRVILTSDNTITDEHGELLVVIPMNSRIKPCEVAEALRRYVAATPVAVRPEVPAELLQWLREHYELGRTPSWRALNYKNLSERAAKAGYTTEQLEACKRALGAIRE